MDSTPGKEHMALYSPSHTSSLQLGKSKKSFTKSKDASYSYDSESYSFGNKFSFSKGHSTSVDRGSSLTIKASAGLGITMGADIEASIASTLEFKAGFSLSYLMSTSVAFGFSRDFKDVRGSYKRASSGDARGRARRRTSSSTIRPAFQ